MGIDHFVNSHFGVFWWCISCQVEPGKFLWFLFINKTISHNKPLFIVWKSKNYGTLTGTDGPVNGIIKHVTYNGFKDAWQFNSIDGALHLIIAKDENGKWQKIDSTEPSLFGWIDELAEQIIKLQK